MLKLLLGHLKTRVRLGLLTGKNLNLWPQLRDDPLRILPVLLQVNLEWLLLLWNALKLELQFIALFLVETQLSLILLQLSDSLLKLWNLIVLAIHLNNNYNFNDFRETDFGDRGKSERCHHGGSSSLSPSFVGGLWVWLRLFGRRVGGTQIGGCSGTSLATGFSGRCFGCLYWRAHPRGRRFRGGFPGFVCRSRRWRFLAGRRCRGRWRIWSGFDSLLLFYAFRSKLFGLLNSWCFRWRSPKA